MRKILLAVAAIAAMTSLAHAQSNPGLTKGQVLTAGQWNALFAGKQDVLGYLPLNVAGGTMTGRLVTAPPGATVAGFNVAPGTAPGSPVNGDLWITTSGFFARVNGATIGPISGPSSGSFAATTPLSVSFPGSVTTYACATCGVTTSPLSQFASTTSAQLAGVLSDESGSGLAVFNNAPTLIAPVLGAATATSINKVTITAPATSATLTIANAKTLTANNTLTLSGTDGKGLVLTNGLTVTGNDGTLSFGGASKTLAVNNSLTFTGTDSTSFAFPSTSTTVAGLGTTQTFSGNNTFSGQSVFTGTSAPASAAGNSVLLGSLASPPTLANNGQAFFFNTTSGGAIVQGSGSSYDFIILNKSAGTVMGVPTGTTTVQFPTLSAGTCSSGLSIDASNNLVKTACGPTSYGTGVLTALGTSLSSAGGLSSTIASGTAALGTSSIASAACATVVTVSATNTLTTDVILASFNSDPTAVTGYVPSTNGMLTIFAYPTAGNANFKVCNNTSNSVTPGAITLNWRVVR